MIDDAHVRAAASPTLAGLLERIAETDAVGIDMPIGLPAAAEKGGRRCEQLARKSLVGRASCVFNSPSRVALAHTDFLAASAANRDSGPDRLGLSKQTFALFPKLREVDALLSADTQDRLFEVHPELSFCLLSKSLCGDGRLAPKKTFGGALERLDLLAQVGLTGIRALLARCREFGAAEDDIIDAAVAAWTAGRKVTGQARRFPEQPDQDPRGLWMEIWA